MSWAIWITGIPGSGKSVRAQAAAGALRARGEPVIVLELDAARRVLTPRPSYSRAEREVVYRSLVYIAVVLTENGLPVIIDATAHQRAWRQLARASIPRFAEVQLVCPLAVCQERERARVSATAPAHIYARAGRPGATVPGVDVAYEPSLAPELVIDTEHEDVATSAARIAAVGRRLAGVALPRRLPSPAGWAIWVTGPPGSGKTTIARSVKRALDARTQSATVLEFERLRDHFLGETFLSDVARDIAHRALVYAAKLLVESGARVIIDATASRRAWRDLARALIPRFAEVQLVCPPDTCRERERAVRWHLVASVPPPERTLEPPEPIGEYEASLNPEMTIWTDVRDVASATADIVRLACRLERTVGAIDLSPEAG